MQAVPTIVAAGHGSRLARGMQSAWPLMPAALPQMKNDPDTVDVPREFHRRMATIIDAVQTGIWHASVHDLLGYSTDYAFGDKRGSQTLVLRTPRRSAYVRLQWETIMGNSPADKQMVENAIHNAIQELT